MEAILTLLLIGAIGGAIRSIIGYEWQSDEGEAFNLLKFLKSVVRAGIGGAGVVYGFAMTTNVPINSAFLALAFFTSMGVDVISKEAYSIATFKEEPEKLKAEIAFLKKKIEELEKK